MSSPRVAQPHRTHLFMGRGCEGSVKRLKKAVSIATVQKKELTSRLLHCIHVRGTNMATPHSEMLSTRDLQSSANISAVKTLLLILALGSFFLRFMEPLHLRRVGLARWWVDPGQATPGFGMKTQSLPGRCLLSAVVSKWAAKPLNFCAQYGAQVSHLHVPRQNPSSTRSSAASAVKSAPRKLLTAITASPCPQIHSQWGVQIQVMFTLYVISVKYDEKKQCRSVFGVFLYSLGITLRFRCTFPGDDRLD